MAVKGSGRTDDEGGGGAGAGRPLDDGRLTRSAKMPVFHSAHCASSDLRDAQPPVDSFCSFSRSSSAGRSSSGLSRGYRRRVT